MSNSEKNLNLNSLKKAEFERAKFWWKWSNWANTAVIVLGLIANLFPAAVAVAAIIATFLAIFSFIAQLISDNAKSTAEWALRQFEMWDGLGWPVNKKDLSDILMNVSKATRAKFEKEDTHPYFDSKDNVSPKRLVKNFMQSAFYTKHQAFFIAKIIFFVSAIIVVVTIFTAIVALQNRSAANEQVISYMLLTAIQLVVATGYLRLGIAYWQFSTDVNEIENRACVLVERKTTNKLDAIRLAHDYQIIRSNAPLLLEWVWKRMEHELNELWNRHRNS